MPERKRDAGTKSTKYAKTAHQDDMSLRCAIPFKMITSLPADDNRRYYSKFPRIRASNAIGGFIKTALPTAVASRTTSHHSLHTHSTHGNDSKNRKNQNSASIAAIMRSTRVFICETEFLEMPNSAATSAMGRSSMTYAR